MTSPEDSMPADTRPKLPDTIPVPSLRTTRSDAAAIETSAVRHWPLACRTALSPSPPDVDVVPMDMISTRLGVHGDYRRHKKCA